MNGFGKFRRLLNKSQYAKRRAKAEVIQWRLNVVTLDDVKLQQRGNNGTGNDGPDCDYRAEKRGPGYVPNLFSCVNTIYKKVWTFGSRSFQNKNSKFLRAEFQGKTIIFVSVRIVY